ncbi:MAG: T9SS type A sorting domain-containing protein [bacterium]|nr:T9SS type A sorting domain-containing protein [bacterium]
MSTKSNNGVTNYWDQKVRMDGIYPTTNIFSSVGITNTPDERVTVWSSLIGSSNFYLIGSFWPNLPSSVGNETETELNSFQLFQNYPNPFNPTTKISWQSPVGGFQSIKVYDVLGNEVARLINEYKPAGSYEVEFNASALSSGIYFYKLQAGSFTETKKMIVIK